MAYFIEFGLNENEDFYQEFVFVDLNSQSVIKAAVDNQFLLRRGGYASVVASNLIGGVQTAPSGAVCVSIPASQLCVPEIVCDGPYGGWGGYDYGFGWRRERQRTVRFELRSAPFDPTATVTPTRTTLIATGTISIGDRIMPNPRIQLGVYPTYLMPAALANITAQQWLRALAQVVPLGPAQLQQAVSADPDDSNRIILNSTGVAPPGGALESMVQTILSLPGSTIAAIRANAQYQSV